MLIDTRAPTPTSRRLRVGALLALLAAGALIGCTGPGDSTTSTDGGFARRVLARGLANPWEVTWGPDGHLWVTEKTAGRVNRISVTDGTVQTALTVGDLMATPNAQDGLLGLALHPDLLRSTAHQYVYLAYTYDADGSATATDRRAKIVQYTYRESSHQLVDPVDLITRLPASVDHDSGRLIYGPDGTLYYTIGDQGHNQYTLWCEPIEAQRLPTQAEVRGRDWSAYVGKILRLNPDGSIPSDNPVLGGVRSHVYTYGHRNAQGIVFGPDGKLYASEQGPKSDDEVNLIQSGRNYGWPMVAGYKDDKSYVYGNWSAASDCHSLRYSDFVIPSSVPTRTESSFTDAAFAPPLATFYTVSSDTSFQDRKCAASYFICWPTITPSSLDIYTAGAVPGWGNSLLVTSLKGGAVYRLPLSADGRSVGEATELWRSVNRYRDIAVSPDGRAIYVATDAGGLARDSSGAPTNRLDDPGAIIEFRYTGPRAGPAASA
jgi:PQQ-dependent dehydrogenase (s-GDH family)